MKTRHRSRRVVGTALLVSALTMVTALPASGVSDEATVLRTLDGDTIEVKFQGTGVLETIRFSGMDTMEDSPKTTNCHGPEATAFMTNFIQPKGARKPRGVRLSATNPNRRVPDGRLVRFVDVDVDGRWVDAVRESLRAGHAVPLIFPGEYDRWKTHLRAAQLARAEKDNVWDDDFCGRGPYQSNTLRLWVSYDADGDDALNINGEYIRVLNAGDVEMKMGGWWIRTGNHDWYILPRGTVLPPGEVLTLHMGAGENEGLDFYWGFTNAQFPNLVSTPTPVGGGAYLFDPDGDVRASAMWPCLTSCTDSRVGKVTLTANSRNPETITLTAGRERVNLRYTVVQYLGSTFELGRKSILEPGESISLKIVTRRPSTPEPNTRYWIKPTTQLKDAGGYAYLRTTDNIMIACDDWGDITCPVIE